MAGRAVLSEVGLAGVLIALLGIDGMRGHAEAFCVAHACNPDDSSGPVCTRDARTGCGIDGAELYRPNGCIFIGVQEGAGSAVGLDDDEVEALILEAFEAWTSVDCGDGPPALKVQSVGAMATEAPYACTLVPDRNVDLWIMSDALSSSSSMSGSAAGVTVPTFIEETGEILDADVLLNRPWLMLEAEQIRDRLRVVAMHEAGHALGLAHSTDRESLMFRGYDVSSSTGLTDDDIAGICALYPPDSLRCHRPTVRAHQAAVDQNACLAAYQEELGGEVGPEGVVIVEQEEVHISPACHASGPMRGDGGPIWLALAAAWRWLHRRRR